MHQLLVLDANDWTTLRRGGTIHFQIGGETYGLITEGSFGRLNPDVADNGASAPPASHAHGGGGKRRYTVKRYTMAQKRKIVDALNTAKERGEKVDAVLTRFGVSLNSGQPYVWRRQFAAEKKRKGA